jgi:phage antirepressor YoqD-like protein
MKQFKLLGTIKIGKFEFTGIKGGFGKGKKSILAKDIANIHNRKIFHINELINNNRNKFKDNVDIIDLLGIGLNDTELKTFNISQQTINSYRGKNGSIYLLSERGYSKLLKLLDDDLAWEIYDEFVDKYFEMRESIKENRNEVSRRDLLKLNIINADTELDRMVALNQYQVEYIKPLEIKEEYHDKVLKSEGLMTISTIGKDLGLSGVKLNKILNDLKIIYKRGKQWYIYSQYADKGYCQYETVLITDEKTVHNLKWTEKDRKFIIEKLENLGII